MVLRSVALGAIAAALALGSANAGGVAAPNQVRTFYEIVVQRPGDRSQGWAGTLFKPDGSPLPMQPGQAVSTNSGTFVPVVCAQLHEPCGFIEAQMKAALVNNIMGPTPWRYRLHVSAECYKSEDMRGELIRGEQSLGGVARDTIETPMGQFEWREGDGEHGWFPKSWPQHMLSPDHWPCKH